MERTELLGTWEGATENSATGWEPPQCAVTLEITDVGTSSYPEVVGTLTCRRTPPLRDLNFYVSFFMWEAGVIRGAWLHSVYTEQNNRDDYPLADNHLNGGVYDGVMTLSGGNMGYEFGGGRPFERKIVVTKQ